MDSPSQAPPPPANLPGMPTMMPPRHQHHALKIATIWVIIISGLIMGVYLLGVYGYLRFPLPGPTSSELNLAFTVPTADGVTWYEMREGSSQPIKHDDYPHATIVGIARSAGKTFVLAQTKDGSNLYQENGIEYNLVYSTSMFLSNLAISTDGKIAAFTAGPPNNEHAIAVTLADQKIMDLGTGSSPVLVFSGGIQNLVYLSGNQIAGASFEQGTWTKPVALYTSTKPFERIAANDDLFAFVDPLNGTASLWKLASFNPLTATPVSTSEVMPLSSNAIAIEDSTVVSYPPVLSVPPDVKSIVVQVTPLSMPHAEPVRFTLLAGTHPTFITLISP